MQQLSFELCRARKLFNMTQEQFAKKSGVVRQTLSSFERNEKCTKKTKYKIAFTICSLLNDNYSTMKPEDIVFLTQLSAKLGYYYENFLHDNQSNVKVDSNNFLTLGFIHTSLSLSSEVFANLLGISLNQLEDIENEDPMPIEIICKLYFVLRLLLEKPRHYNLSLSQVYSMNDYINKLYKIIISRQAKIIDEYYPQ